MRLTTDKITVILQLILASFFVICVWFRFLLPYSYFSIVSIMAVFIAISIYLRMRRGFIVFQILLVFLLINSVYGLSTHYSVLPYGDSYWDYSLVRMFLQSGRVYTFPYEPSSAILTWYSGWPVIHTLASIVSSVTGIAPFYVVQLVPIIISLCFFFVIYLLLEKASGALALKSEVVYLGLLIFALSPDMILWDTQFVRMSLGLLWLGLIFYITYLLLSQSSYRKRGIIVVGVLVAISLVATHHFVSFMAALFLLTLFVFLFLGKRFGDGKIGSRLFPSNLYVPTISFAVLMLVCVLVWWEGFGQTTTILWDTVKQGVTRIINLFTGTSRIAFYVPQASYPAQLAPAWAVDLLRVRDAMMLLPMLLGIPILLIKKPRTPTRFFVVYGMVFFGLMFVINDVSFKIEPFRVVTLAMPFIALLTATTYVEIKIRANRIWKIVLPTIVTLLVLTSFLGLWAHSFAPMHLYNPAIKISEVGEHPDVSRLNVFFETKIKLDDFNFIWGDDFGSLILLLNTSQLTKITRLPDDLSTMGLNRPELFCEVSDLFLYKYYASIYSYIQDPKNATTVAHAIGDRLQKTFDRIYDDGMYKLWET